MIDFAPGVAVLLIGFLVVAGFGAVANAFGAGKEGWGCLAIIGVIVAAIVLVVIYG
jgi:hypothetical protein